MKVLLLCRVSSKTERQDYERQITELTPFCERQKWEIAQVVTAKLSATKTPLKKRTDIQDIQRAVLEQKPDKLVVTEITRAGRTPKDLDYLVEWLRANDVSLYVKNFGIETICEDLKMQSFSNIVFAILKEFALQEVVNLGERIKSGQEHARQQGRHPGRQSGSGMSDEDLLKKYKKVVSHLKAYPEMSLRKVGAAFGISPNTVKAVKEAKERA